MASWLENFFRSGTEALGLEVGTANLKVVDLHGPRLVLRGYAIRPTPPGVIQGGLITEPAALSEEIRALISEARTRKKHVVTTLSNDAVVTRILKFPKGMEEKEIGEAVRWEAEPHIPFSVDEITYDYAILGESEGESDGGEIEVLFAAAREETVVQLVEILRDAGLEPVAVDLKPFASARVLEPELAPREDGSLPLTVVLEVGAESSSIVFLKGERPLMTRHFPVAGNAFTTALARAFGLEIEQAEKIKREYALASATLEDEEALLSIDTVSDQPSPTDIYDALRHVLLDFTTEVQRSLDFFNNQFGEAAPDQAFIGGGGIKLAGLKNLIADAIGITFTEINPWNRLRVPNNRFPATKLADVAPEFVIPVGLAIRGVSGVD